MGPVKAGPLRNAFWAVLSWACQEKAQDVLLGACQVPCAAGSRRPSAYGRCHFFPVLL